MSRHGITHIEDLPPKDFIDAIKSLENSTVTEKVDGSNIHFGFDEDGCFYTSREYFGGGRYYKLSDYPRGNYTHYMRLAHCVLEYNVLPLLRRNMTNGTRIEAEVLRGKEVCNVVPYELKENKIVLLRVVEGECDIEKMNSDIQETMKLVGLKKHTVDVDDAGHQLSLAEYLEWNITCVETKNLKNELPTDVITRVKNMSDNLFVYLKEESGYYGFTNEEVLNWNMNKKPQQEKDNWRVSKIPFKEKKHEIIETVREKKLKIKEELLDNYVRNIRTQFLEIDENKYETNKKHYDSFWIEGVVVSSPNLRIPYKIIDKDVFKYFSNKIHQERRKLVEKPRRVDSDVSILAKFNIELATLLGNPHLAVVGASKEDAYEAMLNGTLNDKTIMKIKDIIEKYRDLLTKEMLCYINRFKFYESYVQINNTEFLNTAAKNEVLSKTLEYYDTALDEIGEVSCLLDSQSLSHSYMIKKLYINKKVKE